MIASSVDSHLARVRLIDEKKFFSCSHKVIDDYFAQFSHLMSSTPPELIFTADETMLESTKINKVVIPNSIREYFEAAPPEFPHITAMCSTNVFGNHLPLFIILKELKNIPPEIKILAETEQIYLASSPNGWMDRWAFLLWTICFIHWVDGFRAKLPSRIASLTGLLIMDGHTSRENPLALNLLRRKNFTVLILPAHCTHVLQLFDVGLASPMKKHFTQQLHECLKK